VNLILFEPGEIDSPLARTDSRAIHLLRVLRRVEGDPFDAGIVDGTRGKATLTAITPTTLLFRFEPGSPPPLADPIHLVLVVALPRPQTARKILTEATSLGVASMRFFQSEKGEPGYASSTLWITGEWRRHLLGGAAQAFDTRLPKIFHDPTLGGSLGALPKPCTRIALDNYEATHRLTQGGSPTPVALAFGPERGWSAAERDILRKEGFQLAHLGTRVLRTETAVIAALAIVKAVA
jgi:16S rRNA (uracil1498-N3)-methyltransferase